MEKVHLRTKKVLKTTTARKKEAILPEHQPWDHKINLKEGAQLKTGPIYKMSDQELRAAKEYIDKNL